MVQNVSNSGIKGAKSTSKKTRHNSGRVVSITASQNDLINVNSRNTPNPISASKIKTYKRVKITPPTQSIVDEMVTVRGWHILPFGYQAEG